MDSIFIIFVLVSLVFVILAEFVICSLPENYEKNVIYLLLLYVNN